MRQFFPRAAFAAMAVTAIAASIEDLCTTDNVQSILPANGTILGVDLLPASVSAIVVYNATAGGGIGGGFGGPMSDGGPRYTYCNVTLSYTHTGKDDTVILKYAFPGPDDFQNRFFVSGGGGYSLSSSATGGLRYGAASGATDAGYGAFTTSYDKVALAGNGSINWDAAHMFGYQALGEMTVVGKALARGFYELDGDAKIYTYFEGCSDGGREGMSQVQRWGEEYDGVIAGAPAYRFAQLQVSHLHPGVVEQTLGYYPPPCELAKIVNATIEACDPLDGRTDGVVSRTDLCLLNFNLTSIIGEPYHCAERNGTSRGSGFDKRQFPGAGSSYQPEQEGTVSAEAVAVAQAIIDSPINSKGERIYLSWQISSEFSDAMTEYNVESGEWEGSIVPMGGGYVARFIQLQDLDNLPSMENVTYDTLGEWMNIGMIRYMDSLQTTLADLEPFRSSGGKLLHFHGESDSSIPAASSVHYWQSVRSIMYPDLSDEEALEALQDWYQFYLVPGAGHCGSNRLQPGPYPQNNMDIMIDWVENGNTPSRLNATVSSGVNASEVQLLCQWPTRPLWQGNSTEFECVEDAESIESWTYDFNAFKIPVY